jgi:hypothetical protein
MDNNFNNLEDVLSHIKINDLVRNNNVSINNCIFNFNFIIEDLYQYLELSYNKIERIRFSNSVFTNPVHYQSHEASFSLIFEKTCFRSVIMIENIHFKKEISFINTSFEGDAIFTNLIFDNYFRLYGSTFYSEVIFAHSELNKKTVFFTHNNNRVQFKGNVNFTGIKFKKANFWNFTFDKDVIFCNTRFDCEVFFTEATFSGNVIFKSEKPSGLTEFSKNIYFDRAIINNIQFEDLFITNPISFNDTKINNITINNVNCINTSLALNGTKIRNIKNEGTARFLKLEATKSSNAFLALEFKSKEMEMRYNNLEWATNFSEKIVLFLNKISNNHGIDWIRGICFTIITWVAFFSLLIMCRDGIGSNFIWQDANLLRESVQYLWLFNGLDGLSAKCNFSEIIIYILGKILISYGIFQSVSAFRKYGKI